MIIKSISKKTTSIKICGITQIYQAKEIAALKINSIGVIGVEGSPRFISKDKCWKIFHEIEKVSSAIERVYVIANNKIENLNYINNASTPPTVIQLHGEESIGYCQELKKKFPTLKLWKAFRLRSIKDLQNINYYEDIVDAVLLDAWDNKYLGGTGNRVPIELLINKNFKIPWILAGGISAEIIPEIFSKIQPDGIDASSRLEIRPGIKDLEKVKSLVRVIREYH